jgi:hypothetical protein
MSHTLFFAGNVVLFTCIARFLVLNCNYYFMEAIKMKVAWNKEVACKILFLRRVKGLSTISRTNRPTNPCIRSSDLVCLQSICVCYSRFHLRLCDSLIKNIYICS